MRRPTRSKIAAVGAGLAIMAACASRLCAGEPSTPPNATELKKMSLEDLMDVKVQTVYAASRHEQKTSQAPASVSIVTEEDIQTYGYRTLGDLLSSVRGFYVDFDRAYSVAGLRGVNRPGSYGDGILLMIDGHRMNDGLVGAAYTYDDFPLDLDLIDRVEIIRGPGSALYGDNAFFSVINVITRRGRDLQGVELSTSAGSFDTYSGRVTYGCLFTNGIEVLASATYKDSAGYDHLHFPEFQSVNGGVADDLDGGHVLKLFSTISYHDLTLEGGFNERRKSLPTAAYGTLFDEKPNWIIDQRSYAELRWQHEYDAWTLLARGTFDSYNYRAEGAFDAAALELGAPGDIVLNHESDGVRSAGGELQASRTFFDKHQVLFGVEGRDDFCLHGLDHIENPPVVVQEGETSVYNFGLYGQDEFSVVTNLTLDLGGRVDHYSTFGNTANPRGALLYSPWETTTLKLLAGRAYRAPNLSEYAYNAPGYVPNFALKPEIIRSYEFDWEQQISRPLRFMAGVYYNEIQNEINQVDQTANPSVGGITYMNIGKADIKGIETELDGNWAHGLRTTLSYTYADGRDSSTGQWLPDSPHHVAKLNLAVPIYRENVYAGFEVQAMSERLSLDRTTTASGAVVANFTILSRELVKGLEVSASLYNIFDTRYADPVGRDIPEELIQQDGRSFRVKLTYRF